MHPHFQVDEPLCEVEDMATLLLALREASLENEVIEILNLRMSSQ